MNSKLQVLVVEDSRDDAALSIIELENAGYMVKWDCVDTEEEFEAALDELEPDLILSDHSMPRFSSRRALQLLKSSKRDIPFIVVSGTIGEEQAVALMKAGAHDYIVKTQLGRLGPAAVRELKEREVRRQGRAIQLALQRSEERCRAIFEHAPVGIALVEHDGIWMQANPYLVRLLGGTRSRPWAPTLHDLFTPKDRETARQNLGRLLRGRTESFSGEYALRCQNGTSVWCTVTAALLHSVADAGRFFVLLFEDISQRKKESTDREKLSNIVRQTDDIILVTDARGRVEYVNPSFCRTTGYALNEILGRNPDFLKSSHHGDTAYEAVWDDVLAGNTRRDVFINRKKNGELYYEETTVSPLKDASGKVSSVIFTGRDITEHLGLQKRVQYLLQHDINTGLPNMTWFTERVRYAMESAASASSRVAVLVLGVERLASVRDALGSDAIDTVISQLVARIRRSEEQEIPVARLSDNTLGVLVENPGRATDLTYFAASLTTKMEAPVQLKETEFFPRVRTGASWYPDDARDPQDLVRKAEQALQRAVETSANVLHFHSQDTSLEVLEKMTLEARLRRALDRGEFAVHFQPRLTIHDGSVECVEALLRWKHASGQAVLPETMIALMEESGLILDVGKWVLKHACQQAARWKQAGLPLKRVSVNLSWRQFQAQDLVAGIAQALKECGLEPECLELELTETTLMHNPARAVPVLQDLKDMGITIAIDDFGTGYSSLSYLRTLPVDVVKIDKCFTQDLDTQTKIVEAIVDLVKSLGCRVVVEGVETRSQARISESLGCDELQGYFISRPLPASQVAAFFPDR